MMEEEEEEEERPAVTFSFSPEHDPALRRWEEEEQWLVTYPVLSWTPLSHLHPF